MAQDLEEQYYANLAYLQAQQSELNEVVATANRVIKHPSRLKYGFLFSLSIIGDLVDLAGLTGIGLILVWLVKLIVSPILFFAGFGASSRVGAMNKFYGEIQQDIAGLTRKMMFYSRMYARALRFSRKTGILKKPIRRAALKIGAARKAIIRSPALKMGAAGVADLMPGLDLFPWRTIGVYLAYRDEKKTYLETQPIVPEYIAAKTEEIDTTNVVLERTAEIADLAEEGSLPTEESEPQELPYAA